MSVGQRHIGNLHTEHYTDGLKEIIYMINEERMKFQYLKN